jgi:hypothetical protein
MSKRRRPPSRERTTAKILDTIGGGREVGPCPTGCGGTIVSSPVTEVDGAKEWDFSEGRWLVFSLHCDRCGAATHYNKPLRVQIGDPKKKHKMWPAPNVTNITLTPVTQPTQGPRDRY